MKTYDPEVIEASREQIRDKKSFYIDQGTKLTVLIAELENIVDQYGASCTYDIDYDSYDDNWCIFYYRPENDKEVSRRLRHEDREKEERKSARQKKREKEAAEYLRLKKKFEK